MSDPLEPTIDFYYMPESPPCRAVEMVASIVGVNLNKKYINLLAKDQYKEEFLKLNPLHQVPFIVDGELKLGQSRAIMTYLVERYLTDNETFYPKDPVRRAKVNEIIFFDSSSLNQSSSRLFYPMTSETFEKLNEEHEKQFKNNVNYLDQLLKERNTKFIVGDDLTLGDICIISTLSLAEACAYDLGEYEHLLAYLARLRSTIKNYSDINNKPMENMKNYIASKRKHGEKSSDE